MKNTLYAIALEAAYQDDLTRRTQRAKYSRTFWFCNSTAASQMHDAFVTVELADVPSPSIALALQPDYPNLRRGVYCALCRRGKDAGLVVCWPCYREHDFRNGPDQLVNETLDKAEAAGVPINPERRCPCGWPNDPDFEHGGPRCDRAHGGEN